MQLAAILVQATKLDPVVGAVRAAYASIGAVEIPAKAAGTQGALRVLVGTPKQGWSTITDSTHHTVDLGAAEAIAAELGKRTRVLALAIRGASVRGRAASKAFGPWSTKPPTSGKPAALSKVIGKLGKDLLPQPWELDDRPGTVLAFDTSRATLTPGPFQSTSASELREAQQHSQLDATWWVSNHALNGRYADAVVALGGLRDPWGWQTALDHLMHSLHSHAMKLEAGSAKLYLQVAGHALADVTTANLFDKWLVLVGGGNYPTIRHGLALQCALVAHDEAAWARYLGAVMPDHRARVGLQVWRRTPLAIAALPPKVRAWLERDLPVRDILAWAQTAPHDPKARFLDTAAELAALHGDDVTLDRAFRDAATDPYLAGGLGHAAYSLVREGHFRAALALYDRLIAAPPSDLTVFTNALYAVQRDNNKLPLDRARARRYVDAAAPHADQNPPIWINIAAVEQELGNREAVFAALAGAKRHKLKRELAELRDEAMFKSLRRDPAFLKLVGAGSETKKRPGGPRRLPSRRA